MFISIFVSFVGHEFADLVRNQRKKKEDFSVRMTSFAVSFTSNKCIAQNINQKYIINSITKQSNTVTTSILFLDPNCFFFINLTF